MLGAFHIEPVLPSLVSHFVAQIAIIQRPLSHRRCPTLVPHGDKEMWPPSLRAINGYAPK